MTVTANQETNTADSDNPIPTVMPTSNPVASPSPAKEAPKNGSRRLLWSIIGISIFTIISIAVWIWWDEVNVLIEFITDQEAFGAYLRSFGVLGPLVLFIAQFIQVIFAFIPGHVIVIAGGYVYGFALGFLFNITFTVASSQFAFLLARWLGRPVVYRLANRETVDYWERLANQRGVLFFTIAFILPIFPSDAMNFVAGLTGLSARRFLIANFTGRLPSIIMLTAIGAFGLEFSNLMWGVVILVYLIFFIAGRFVYNAIRREAAENGETGELAEGAMKDEGQKKESLSNE